MAQDSEGITLPQPYDEFMVGLREYRHAQGIEDYRPLLFPGVEETLKQLKARGKKLALASSSSFASIEKMLSDTGLYAYFELVTSGGMFKESKPNPEIYLFTAKEAEAGSASVSCGRRFAIWNSGGSFGRDDGHRPAGRTVPDGPVAGSLFCKNNYRKCRRLLISLSVKFR